MPSSERKWKMSDVWRRVMHVPLSRVELDEPQRHGDGRRCGTNSRSHHRTGPACSRSRTRVNHRQSDTENSDAKEIRELKAKSGVQEKQIKRLEGKMAEQTHLLQETLAKLTNVEQTVYKTQAIDRLEENIAKLDRDLPEMTAAIRSMVNRGDARKANHIQSPKANAPDRSQSPQDKIAEPSSAESRQSKRPALTIGHLETNVVVLDSPLPKPLGSEDAGGKRDQKTSANYQKRPQITEGKRTNKPLLRAPPSLHCTMSQGPEHWLLFEQPIVDYDATEGLFTVTSEVRENPAPPQEILLDPYFAGPGELPYTSHSIASMHTPGMIEEQDDMAFLNKYLLSLKLDDIPDVDGNKSSQLSDTGHFSSQESPGILIAGQDLRISTNGSGSTPAPWPIPDPSPVEPYAVGQIVVPLEAAEEKSVVASLQIQQAAASRRKKEGIYECQFRNAGCPATFTERHNLRYHHNSHLGLKPYKCGKCSYATASPATTRRHQLTCKVALR